MTLVAAETLTEFVTACYCAMGVPDAAARTVATTLVQADLWGHPSHGVMRVFWYGKRIESGAISLAPVPLEAPTGLAIQTMDGADGLGQVIAQEAMMRAIAAAKRHGIGAVAVRNSGHFGMAMSYTQMAAQAGCVGFIAANASPAMAPWGGLQARVGTNPWSWAAPAGRHPPMMLDIANTAVARGKLYVAQARGEAIPEGWAMGPDGTPTTDPAQGILGTILPMAGHKGYAIGLITDMLAGVLSGSAFGAAVTGPYKETGRSGAGHLVLAIDIAACRPLAEFEADMETLIAEIKATPKTPETQEIYYPGEREALAEIATRKTGIDLPDRVIDDLRQGATRLGLLVPF